MLGKRAYPSSTSKPGTLERVLYKWVGEQCTRQGPRHEEESGYSAERTKRLGELPDWEWQVAAVSRIFGPVARASDEEEESSEEEDEETEEEEEEEEESSEEEEESSEESW